MPDASNTGVQSGVTLKASGPLVINTAGAVIEGLDISGGVIINAPNVTLLNCKITSSDYQVVLIKPGVTGAVVQNCTIDGKSVGNQGIAGQGSFIANNIMNCSDGIDVRGDNTLIQDNYIHNMAKPAGAHPDGIQADGGFDNLKIIHNTVVNEVGDNASLMLSNYWGPINGAVIDHNAFLGGGYTVYLGEMGSQPAGGGGPITNLSFTNNIVSEGGYGYMFLRSDLGHVPVISGNVDNVTGALLAVNNAAPGTGTPSIPAEIAAPSIASWSSDTGAAGDGITSDNTLQLKGTAAANSTIKIYDGSTQIGTTTASSTGSWDYITSVLSNAKHVLTATATNSSGQTSAKSGALTMTVDTVAPTAPTMATPTNNANGGLNLAGTAEANSVVKVFDGTTQIGTATANSSGAWGYTTGALAAGSHSLTAKATDVAGNTSAASAVVTASTGTSAPPVPPTSPTPAPGEVVESAGVTSLVESGGKYFLNSSSGSGPTLKYGGADFVDGQDGTWTPIGAEKTATGYQVAWKEASTGQYTAWNTDNNGNYVSHVSALTGSVSGGQVSGTNDGLKLLETSFHQDLNGDGQVGASSAPAPTSSVDLTTMYKNWSDIVTIKGVADANSQIKLYDGNTSLGTVTAAADGTWSFKTWSAVSDTVHTYTAKQIDSTGQVVGTSGNAVLGSTGSNTLTGTSGDDLFVGNGGADTFVFAQNFGNDVIKDFGTSGRSHDVVQFSKSVFDSFASVLAHATQVGQDVVISADANNSLTLKNTKLSAIDKYDFQFS
jgi:hypothetical protein